MTQNEQIESATGIKVVLSSVQMAAVLGQDNLGEDPTLTNRFLGSLRVVGGVLELAGAGVLCLAPEPTMASKAGCVLFGINGADNTATGARQVWTGLDTQSLTKQGTAMLAQTIGADPGLANNIGLTVDIAVPLALSSSLGAARIAAVRAGRINLLQHEAQSGSRLGGHTVLKHVGRTEQDLRARLAAQPFVQTASSFTNLQTAESAISKVLGMHANTIKSWATVANSPPLKLELNLGAIVGIGVVRTTNQLVNLRKVRVILKMQSYNGMPYYVLTAFPII
jgi:Bacterial CdiA-CT RNAse A domain